jgi:hypothetical protein
MKVILRFGILLVILGLSVFAFEILKHTNPQELTQIQEFILGDSNSNPIPIKSLLSVLALSAGVIITVSLAIPEDCRV